MRMTTLTSAGLLALASVGFVGLADSAAAAPITDQCVNPQTGEILQSEFCLCQLRPYQDEEFPIVELQGGGELVCPTLPDTPGQGASILVIPDNDGGGGNGGGNGNGNVNWPGWGYGDPKHNHTGPPPASLTGAPGQSDEGPPGLREFDEN